TRLLRARLAWPKLTPSAARGMSEDSGRGAAPEARGDQQLAFDLCWTLCRALPLPTAPAGAAAALADELLRRAARLGDSKRLSRALSLDLGYRAREGWARKSEIARSAARALALAAELGEERLEAWAEIMTGEAWMLLGSWRRARLALERSEQILRARPEAEWERRRAEDLRLALLMKTGGAGREIDPLLARAPEAIQRRYGWWRELCGDRPGRALDALGPSAGAESATVSYQRLVAETEIAIYRGDTYRAWHALEERWGARVEPSLEASEMLRVEAWHLRGRAALAALAQRPEGTDAPGLGKEADRAARALERIGSPWSGAAALLVRSGLESFRHEQRYGALERLQRAEARLGGLEMAQHAEAARLQRAALKPSAVSPERRERATRKFAELGVVEAQRMADLLAPGGWRVDLPTGRGAVD
ncbi:MAG: hypothetical protein AAF725_18230, partial [Acidobacteriota bacterium]